MESTSLGDVAAQRERGAPRVALAIGVGILGAAGNAGFRLAIEGATELFHGLAAPLRRPGRAARAGTRLARRRARLRVPALPRDGAPARRPPEATLDHPEGARLGDLARGRRVGRTRGADRADRRLDRGAGGARHLRLA